MKILVWGTGKQADRLLPVIGNEEEIVSFVESKKSKDFFHGKKVYAADEIKEVDCDVIAILSSYEDEIRSEIEKQCIESAKVIFPSISKIGIIGNFNGGGYRLDWLGTEKCSTWMSFGAGIFTNSNQAAKEVQTVLNLQDFWKEKIVWTPPVQTKRTQQEFLEKYFIPNLHKDDVILDFACADGQWSEVIAPYVKRVDGFDCSEKMLETARKNSEEKQLSNVFYQYMDAVNVRFECRYDHIMMLGLLTCIDDDGTADRIVKTVAESINEGGYLVVRDTLNMYEPDDVYYNEQTYSAIYRAKDNYEEIYLRNGFELVAYQYLNPYFSHPIELGSHGYVFRKKQQ